MENAKCYAPQILVGTEGLPREQWLEYRRKGIGGSDAAAVLGISPFRTGRDLYYDKLNIVTADDAENWVQLEVGRAIRSTAGHSCSSTRCIPGCWRIWIIWWNCRTVQQPSLRSKPRIITPRIHGYGLFLQRVLLSAGEHLWKNAFQHCPTSCKNRIEGVCKTLPGLCKP